MTHQEGNLLAVKEGILVHGCNAQGVMGAGVAAAVRKTHPGAYEVYAKAYRQARHAGKPDLPLGEVIWFVASKDPPRLAIANGITQRYFGADPAVRYVDYDAVRQVFRTVAAVARRHQLPVHYPLIGAGLAKGDWSVIAHIIDEELEGLSHTLWTLPGMPPPARRPRAP